MKKLIKQFLTFLILQFFTEKEIFQLAETVSKQRQFISDVQTIDVKKGQRKYTLIVVRALNGVYKINLGRFKSEQEINLIGHGYAGE